MSGYYDLHLELQRAAEKPPTAGRRLVLGPVALAGVAEFVVAAAIWNGWLPIS